MRWTGRRPITFEDVWQRIGHHAGEEFRTVADLSFTYEAYDAYIRPSGVRQNISKGDFRKAYELLPLQGPGTISKTVRGPSYVYAILSDPRIVG